MSHISSGVEYSLHCLLFLTRYPGSVEEASVRDLAELQGVPSDFLSKLFTKLVKAELVVATEGVKGGVKLARPANQITVHDVVNAIDGDKLLFECREIRSRCTLFNGDAPAWATRGVCSIHAVMQAAEMAMRAELNQHTLADLAQRVSDKAPDAFGGQVVTWLTDRISNRHGDKPKAMHAKTRKHV